MAQLGHHAQIVGGKQQRHLADFLDADAMLAGEAPAHLDARFQNVTAGIDRATHLTRYALVVQDDRMA